VRAVLVKPLTPSTLYDCILDIFGKAIWQAEQSKLPQTRSWYFQQLAGASVLLVEDNPVNQEMAVELLQQAGMQVAVAENGAVALALVQQQKFDLVLMDCQMPVMDGFTASREIRKLPQFAGLPILAMTANAMADDKLQCFAAGMNAHIAKPIDVDELYRTLWQWLPGAQAAQPGPALAPPADVMAGLPAAIPPIAGLQLEQALRRLGGDKVLLQKTLRRFVTHQRDSMTALQAATPDDQVRLLHTLKGLAATIGADTLAAQVASAEQACRRGELSEAVVQAITKDLSQLCDDINAWLPAEPAPAAVVSLPDADSRAGLLHLRQLLADDDGAAVHLLAELLPALQRCCEPVLLKQLTLALDNFDFEQALALLAPLLATMEHPDD